MKKSAIFGVCWITIVFFSPVTKGVILYESAAMGPTGQLTGTGCGQNESFIAYSGKIFEVDIGLWEVTAVGGHFTAFSGNTGTLFAAIVPLDGVTGFPADPPFDFIDVLASTTFIPDDFPGSDHRIPLNVTLEPGGYALVFGAQDLGASNGNMVINLQPGYENPSAGYPIYAQVENDGTVQSWGYDFSHSSRTSQRFVIEGTFIPEPATLLLLGFGTMALLRKPR